MGNKAFKCLLVVLPFISGLLRSGMPRVLEFSDGLDVFLLVDTLSVLVSLALTSPEGACNHHLEIEWQHTS